MSESTPLSEMLNSLSSQDIRARLSELEGERKALMTLLRAVLKIEQAAAKKTSGTR